MEEITRRHYHQRVLSDLGREIPIVPENFRGMGGPPPLKFYDKLFSMKRRPKIVNLTYSCSLNFPLSFPMLVVVYPFQTKEKT